MFSFRVYEIEIGGFGRRRSCETTFGDMLFPTICLDLLRARIPNLELLLPMGSPWVQAFLPQSGFDDLRGPAFLVKGNLLTL